MIKVRYLIRGKKIYQNGYFQQEYNKDCKTLADVELLKQTILKELKLHLAKKRYGLELIYFKTRAVNQ